VPPGLALTEADIQPQLTRRRPGQSRLTTPRDEADLVAIQAGTEKGHALGTPLCLVVSNLNVRPGDYAEMATVPRPGHADATYQFKYGLRASSGGGRASARETIGRVAAGAVAEKFLREAYGTEIVSFVTSVGDVEMPAEQIRAYTRAEVDDLGTLQVLRGTVHGSTWSRLAEAKEQRLADEADEAVFVRQQPQDAKVPAYIDLAKNVFTREGVLLKGVDVSKFSTEEVVAVRCPHAPTACRIASLIRVVKSEQDSVGGTVACVCTGVPVGLGEPCFDKLEALMAHAMLSLPATKGFEIGLGFRASAMRGSQHNDPFEAGGAAGITPATNNAGGTLGGISTGCATALLAGGRAGRGTDAAGRPQGTHCHARGRQARVHHWPRAEDRHVRRRGGLAGGQGPARRLRAAPRPASCRRHGRAGARRLGLAAENAFGRLAHHARSLCRARGRQAREAVG
jgi:chorismate synthase